MLVPQQSDFIRIIPYTYNLFSLQTMALEVQVHSSDHFPRYTPTHPHTGTHTHARTHARTHTHTHFNQYLLSPLHLSQPYTPAQHGLIYLTTQGALFQKYLETLVQELSPSEQSPASEKPSVQQSHKHSQSLSAIKDLPLVPPPAPMPPRRGGSSAVAPSFEHLSSSFSLGDDDSIAEETEL